MELNTQIGANGAPVRPFAARAEIIPGSFFLRLIAVFIDGFICGMINMIPSLVLAFLPLFAKQVEGPMVIVATLLSFAISISISFCYGGYFFSVKGATPGKMIFNLRLVDRETGSNISFVKGGLRETLGKFISFVTLMIGFIMALFNRDRLALHDLIFSTRVIRVINN